MIGQADDVDLIERAQSVNGLRVLLVLSAIVADALGRCDDLLFLVLVEIDVKLSFHWTMFYCDALTLLFHFTTR